MPTSFRRLSLYIALILLGGCVGAQMVSPPRSGSAYAPVNEGERVGVIKYLNGGADRVINARREDAFKQMHEACGGRYQIVGEGEVSEGGTVIAYANTASYVTDSYWYIQFQCVQ